jgi:hypothetical protein
MIRGKSMFGGKKRREEETRRQEEAMTAALQQDDAAALAPFVEEVLGGQSERFDLCMKAVENNAARCLALLLSRRGFDFSSSCDTDKDRTRQLIKKSLTMPSGGDLVAVIAAANETTPCSSLERYEFVNPTSSVEVLQQYIEDRPEMFKECIERVGLFSTEKLRFILSFTSRINNPQPILDEALINVAKAGDAEKTKVLLDRGADANYACAQALSRAAEGGHSDVVALLLPLVQLDVYGSDLMTQLEAKGVAPAIIDAMKFATENAAAIEAPPVKEETAPALSPFARIDADTLAETQALPGGTLITVFNFRSQQQKNIYAKNDGTPPAITIVSFTDIDKTVLASMRTALDELNTPAQKQPEAAPPAPIMQSSSRFGERAKRAGLS